jgi:hypothetical protein
MIDRPEVGSYAAAVDVLGWCHSESGVDSRTRDALYALLEYVCAVDERLRDVMEHNELSRGL